MRLKSVTLHNFRCFEHLRIDLHPRLTVFVGDNGAGKTAVLDGIATALSPVLTQLSSADQRLSGRRLADSDFRRVASPGPGGKPRWGTAEQAGVAVECFSEDGLQWDLWRESAKSSAIPKNKLGTDKLKARMRALTKSYRTPAPELTPVIAYYGARRGYIEVPGRRRTTMSNYGHPTSALIGALDAMGSFREMLTWFDGEEAAELRANRGQTGEHTQTRPTLDTVRTAVTELLHNNFRSPHFNEEHQFVLIRDSDGAPMLVNQLSQGYQAMLALAMDFARRLALGNSHLSFKDDFANDQIITEVARLHALVAPNDFNVDTKLWGTSPMNVPAIMLVDEIDLHLHPTWQQRVLADLMRVFPLTQFIVTTHSPQVLSTVAKENIRVLQMTDDGLVAQTPNFSPLAHESGDALAKIMGTHREPELPALQDAVRGYEQIVRAGQEDSQKALALRTSLERAGYQFHDSDLKTWRFLAARLHGAAR